MIVIVRAERRTPNLEIPMAIHRTRRADLYFTVTQFEFRALHQSFQLVEQNLQDLLKRRAGPSWDGRPETSGHAVKAQLHQSLVDDMMPQAFRASVIIGLWGILESTLLVIDGTIRKLLPGSTTPLPQGARFLGNAIDHFPKQLGIALFADSATQVEAVYLQKLRHVLSHANGLQEAAKYRDWEFLSSYSKKHVGIDLTRGFVDMSAQFVGDRFAFMARVLEHLLMAARSRLEALNAP